MGGGDLKHGEELTEQPSGREAIASRAANKIAEYPAVSQSYMYAVILDALNEAADLERYRAEVEKRVFGK